MESRDAGGRGSAACHRGAASSRPSGQSSNRHRRHAQDKFENSQAGAGSQRGVGFCQLCAGGAGCRTTRSEEHTSELQSLMRISYAVFCLKKKKKFTHVTHYFTIYVKQKIYNTKHTLHTNISKSSTI